MYICIDIGGTAIKYGLAAADGTLQAKGTLPTHAKEGGGPRIIRTVQQLIRDTLAVQPLEGIALSTAGMVDPIKGDVFYALPASIPDYTGTHWKALLTQEFHLPCAVENDVNCAALLKLYSRRRQEAFDRMIAASRPTLIHVGDAEVPVLDEIPNIVYTFAHLWYHFVELGVGLRQLCDLAILINRSFPCDLDEKCLQARTASLIATLDSLEMRGAFAIVECVMHDYLGLTRLPLPVSRSVQAMSGIMTKRIFKYGNFGKYGRNGQRGEWKFYVRLLADRIITILRFRNYDKKELTARLIKEVPSKMWRVISGRAAED